MWIINFLFIKGGETYTKILQLKRKKIQESIRSLKTPEKHCKTRLIFSLRKLGEIWRLESHPALQFPYQDCFLPLRATPPEGSPPQSPWSPTSPWVSPSPPQCCRSVLPTPCWLCTRFTRPESTANFHFLVSLSPSELSHYHTLNTPTLTFILNSSQAINWTLNDTRPCQRSSHQTPIQCWLWHIIPDSDIMKWQQSWSKKSSNSAFCLAAGTLTLFMSLLAIVAGYAVKEAVADGRVSEEERRVIWCVANQNNLLVTLQILCFVALFGFVVYYFDKVGAPISTNSIMPLVDCLLFRSVSQTPRAHSIARGTFTLSASYSPSRWSPLASSLSSSSFGYELWTRGETEIFKSYFMNFQLPRAGLFFVHLKWLHYRWSIMVVVIDNTSIDILRAAQPVRR